MQNSIIAKKSRIRLAFTLFFALSAAACHAIPPPRFQPPGAAEAVAQARKTHACGSSIEANGKIDHFGKSGRFRGSVMMFVAPPTKLRIDVVSPFGVALASLASNDNLFSLVDIRERHFFSGAASACSMAQFVGISLEPATVIDLLVGKLPHNAVVANGTKLKWSGRGYYVIRATGAHGDNYELHLGVDPNDIARPWELQRLRLVGIYTTRGGRKLYSAEFGDFSPGLASTARIDPDGIDAPIEPSGPACTADVAHKVRVEVPDEEADLQVRYEHVTWNPPIPADAFQLVATPEMTSETVFCR